MAGVRGGLGVRQPRIKNHHVVPKVLQKAFRFEGDRLWYSERDNSGVFSQPVERNIEKAFRIKDYYTVEVNGELSDVVERQFYGRIDDYLGRVLPSIFSAFERGDIPTFSGEALASLQKVVFEMIKRTPQFVKSYNDEVIGREIIEKELARYNAEGKMGPERDRALRDLDDMAVLKSLGRSVRVKAVTREMRRAQDVLADFEVRWAISDARHSFILSDMIAYRIGNGGSNGLSNPDAEIWMPISPKLALVFMRDPEKKVPPKVVESQGHVRAVNEYAVANSDRIASHSERLLKSLTASRSKP